LTIASLSTLPHARNVCLPLLLLLALATAAAGQKKIACPDGEHIEIDVRQNSIQYNSSSFAGTVNGLGVAGVHLEVSQKQLQEAAVATQKLNEIFKWLAAGYNSCAVTRQQYSDSFNRLTSVSTSLNDDAAELEKKRKAIVAGQKADTKKLQQAVERFNKTVQQLRELERQLTEKDKEISEKNKQLEDRKLYEAKQQSEIDELKREVDKRRDSPLSDGRSAAEISSLRDKIAAQNSKIKDLEDPLLQTELQRELGAITNELDMVCESFAECMSRGQRAYNSQDWSAAVGFFRQAALVSPELPLAWHWVGHSSMAAGRVDEAYAAWDRIVTLHGAVPLAACEEVGQPRCEGGVLHISSDSLARYQGDRKIFEVPLSSVSVIGTKMRGSPSHSTFEVRINGVSHIFDFFPLGVQCAWSKYLTCPKTGQDQQTEIGDYAEKTIRRLVSSEGMGPGVMPAGSPETAKGEAPPAAGDETQGKVFDVQSVLPSEFQKLRVWPGSPNSTRLLVEDSRGVIHLRVDYEDVTSVDLNRRSVRLPLPGELFHASIGGPSGEKVYELCFKTREENRKMSYCFISESAVCKTGEPCLEGSDAGVSILELTAAIKSHLLRHK